MKHIVLSWQSTTFAFLKGQRERQREITFAVSPDCGVLGLVPVIKNDKNVSHGQDDTCSSPGLLFLPLVKKN